jgi:hypothetical protein
VDFPTFGKPTIPTLRDIFSIDKFEGAKVA